MNERRQLLSAGQCDRQMIDRLFSLTDLLRQKRRTDAVFSCLRGQTVCLLFFEPSTRTRLSFSLAVHSLGGRTEGSEAAGSCSSAAKGETIEDTMRVLESYGIDAVVIRHPQRGIMERAAGATALPIINAGDGDGEHPTQALLDLYTITRLVPKARKTIAFCGDIKHSRTIRSLCRLLSAYDGGTGGVRLIFCSAPQLAPDAELTGMLDTAHLDYEITDNIADALRQCDVFYQTRVQQERFANGQDGMQAAQTVADHFSLSMDRVCRMKPGAIILHPLPRIGEIDTRVDADPRAKYFTEQTRNGLYVRMALLVWILRPDFKTGLPWCLGSELN